MKKILILSLLLIPFVSLGQTKEESNFKKNLKKNLKFATLYTAVTGNNSLADVNTYSLLPDGSLEYGSVSTPFDYTLTFGVRKIARLGYENRKNVFYNGTETSVSDAATVGRIKGLEFLFELIIKDNKVIILDQQHFLRYVHDHWILKGEYVQTVSTDIKYFESSQRYRYNVGEKVIFQCRFSTKIL